MECIQLVSVIKLATHTCKIKDSILRTVGVQLILKLSHKYLSGKHKVIWSAWQIMVMWRKLFFFNLSYDCTRLKSLFVQLRGCYVDLRWSCKEKMQQHKWISRKFAKYNYTNNAFKVKWVRSDYLTGK